MLAERTYRVDAGDSRSRDYRITVTERPLVTKIAVQYSYPKYTQLDESSVEDCAGIVRAVKGSSANLAVHANKRLSSARLNFGDEDQSVLGLKPGHVLAVTNRRLFMEKSKSGHVEIEDEFGCRNARPIQIVAVADRAPQVKIVAPAADRTLGVGESLVVGARGTDDFGVVRADLIEKRMDPESHSVGEPRVVRSWSDFSDPRNVAIDWKWTFEKKSYKNGEIIRYFVRMEDGNDLDGPGVGTSAEFAARLEDAAALQKQREVKYEGWQAELEKVLKEQKELRGLTEEMERRAGLDRKQAGPDEASEK